MKKVAVIICLLVIALSAACAEDVLLEQNFDNGFPDGWLSIDNDGDGKEWKISTGASGNNNTKCILSASYDGGVLNPDNWLITPQVTLATSNVLSYLVAIHNTSYPAEHYGVYISETGTEVADFELLFEETMTAKNNQKSPGEFSLRTIVIPESYNNKSVYMAIRHFNCSGQDKLKIDDLVLASGLSVEENNFVNPKSVELLGNYPNPFNPNTIISFKLNNTETINLSVFNAKGQLVEELINSKLNRGVHKVSFKATNLNSGVYYYKLEAEGLRMTKKMLLIK